MPTILHTADVHLGKTWTDLGPAAERLAELHWQCFERLARLALERGAVALVIAGDLFERPDPPAKLIAAVRGAFKRLTGQGVSVVIGPGTHDGASSPLSVYRSTSLGGARVFLSPRLGERFVAERSGEAVAFQGLAWDPQATPADFLADYARGSDDVPEVLLLHGEVGEGKQRRRKDLPVSARQLSASGADYVALGHRHEHREFKSSGRLWGAYPGTPFGLSFKGPELGPRTACLVALGVGGEVAIERAPSTEVEWLHLELDLGDSESQEDLAAAARRSAGAEKLALLELAGVAGFPLDTEHLAGELAGEFLHLRLDDLSVELAPEAVEDLAEEHSVRGIFVRRMLGRLEAARNRTERAEASAGIREGLQALAEEGG